jgi:hypothetical protein
MTIPVSQLWKPTPLDLHAIAENAKAAKAILAIPPLKRRARMVEYGYPRHLYKFRDIPHAKLEHERGRRKQLEDMLLNNELFAATAETFNDPFDAQADYRIDERGAPLRDQVYGYLRAKGAAEDMARAIASDEGLDEPEVIAAEMKANHQQVLKQLGVCCLAATAHDPLLWAHYAYKHTGIAVQYRPSLDPESLQPHEVEYKDEYPVITDFFDPGRRSLFPPLLRKSLSWRYEKEWRILRTNAPNRVFRVRPEALTGVLLGMRISDANRDYIRMLVELRDRRYGLATRVFQAEAAPGEYRVRMRRLL